MTRNLKLLLLCLLLLSVYSEAQKASDSCGTSTLLASLSKGTSASLLKTFGYDLAEPWACKKVDASWVPGATILRFEKITVQTDDHTAFSVMKVPGLEYVWVVPTTAGMLEVGHAESDPHNIAAFNALLRLHKQPIDAAGWLEAGRLYMALLGHSTVVQIKGESSEAGCNKECLISFSDRPVITGEAYNKWTLSFEAPSRNWPAMLTDVSRETVH